MARVNKNGTNPDMFLGCLFLGATNYESPLYAPVFCTAGAPTVPCPYTKYLGSVRNKGAENIGLDENRVIGKECRLKLWNSEPEETLKRMCSDGLRNVHICFLE